MHLVGDGLWCRVVRKAVEVDGVEPCLLCAQNVSAEVIANHEGAFRLCA